jgi:hypothetical protein
MPVVLDHLIVPAHDPVKAAELLARLLGVAWEAQRGHFTPVYVNDGLTLDFAQHDGFEHHHYCFRVGEAEFDGIFERIQASGIVHRSQPNGPDDRQINTRLGGRNVYWTDADGHVWEILTVSYARPSAPITASPR